MITNPAVNCGKLTLQNDASCICGPALTRTFWMWATSTNWLLRVQSWALSVYFNFFTNKKLFSAFLIKLIWLGVGFLNRTGAEIGYQFDKNWKNVKIPKVPSSGYDGARASGGHSCQFHLQIDKHVRRVCVYDLVTPSIYVGSAQQQQERNHKPRGWNSFVIRVPLLHSKCTCMNCMGGGANAIKCLGLGSLYIRHFRRGLKARNFALLVRHKSIIYA